LKLLEHEAKAILQRYGIMIPQGYLSTSADQAAQIARDLNRPVYIKAQIGVAGRGKAGGILPAANSEEARLVALRLLGSQVEGLKVSSLLVEEKLEVQVQYYLSIAIDREARRFVILASKSGGIDIEDVARLSAKSIARYWVDPLKGLSEHEAALIAARIDLPSNDMSAFTAILIALYQAALQNDAELVELNPLVKVAGGSLVAADARLIIDDNALFRHPEFSTRTSPDGEQTPLEQEARRRGLSYVDLEGDIGVIGNGAGLVMATLDIIDHFGGKAANFLDIGGGASLEDVKNGVLLVMGKPSVRAVLIDILGGITRCDQVAEGIVEALNASTIRRPIAVRMMGTNDVAGQEVLRLHGIGFFPDMEKAAEAAIRSARGF
jgi:succinyl-CoA synthetase beta subunit